MVLGRSSTYNKVYDVVDTTSTQYSAEVFENIVLATRDSRLLKDMYMSNSLFRNALDREGIRQRLAVGFMNCNVLLLPNTNGVRPYHSFGDFIRWIDDHFYSAECIRKGMEYLTESLYMNRIIYNDDVDVLRGCVGRIQRTYSNIILVKMSRQLVDVFIQYALESEDPVYETTNMALITSVLMSDVDTIKKVEEVFETLVRRRIANFIGPATDRSLYSDITNSYDDISVLIGEFGDNGEIIATREALVWMKWSDILLLRDTYNTEIQSYIIDKILKSIALVP